MKYLSLIALLALSACGPAANAPSATPSAHSSDAAATAKVLVSKQAYIDFLTCAKAAEASAEHQATIQTGIDNVKELPEAGWDTLKTSLSISAEDFVTRYSACVK